MAASRPSHVDVSYIDLDTLFQDPNAGKRHKCLVVEDSVEKDESKKKRTNHVDGRSLSIGSKSFDVGAREGQTW